MRLAASALLLLAASGCITDLLCGSPSASPPTTTRGQVIEQVGWAACEHQRGCSPKDFAQQTIQQCVDAMKAHELNQSAGSAATPEQVTACEHAISNSACGGVPAECTRLLN